jgi:hypothetical protein
MPTVRMIPVHMSKKHYSLYIILFSIIKESVFYVGPSERTFGMSAPPPPPPPVNIVCLIIQVDFVSDLNELRSENIAKWLAFVTIVMNLLVPEIFLYIEIVVRQGIQVSHN